MAHICFNHLTKRYGPIVAVDDFTVTLQPGRITGFLGPNGAGKSTTLRMLVGLTTPSGGTATIDGLPYLTHARMYSGGLWISEVYAAAVMDNRRPLQGAREIHAQNLSPGRDLGQDDVIVTEGGIENPVRFTKELLTVS